MKRFDFENLEVYQLAIIFAQEVYQLTSKFPQGELFGLGSQLRRAAVSISANIAEGYGRSRRESLRYYGIARGSTCECIPLLTIARQTDLLDTQKAEELRERCVQIERMLSGLAASFRSSPSPIFPLSPRLPPSPKPLPLSRGFTLVELLIVVTILGILVAMVVPRLAGRTEQARRARAEADVKGSIPLALDLFEVDTGKYPTTEEGLEILLSSPPDADTRNWHGPYLKQPPTDPWGRSYRYVYPGVKNPKDYDLFSVGPDGTEGTSDDIGNWKK